MLKIEHTVRSYSGNRGCMCGCKGTYTDSPVARTRAIRKLLADPDTKMDVFFREHNDGSAGCIYVETPTRNNVLFLTAQGVGMARLMEIEEKK